MDETETQTIIQNSEIKQEMEKHEEVIVRKTKLPNFILNFTLTVICFFILSMVYKNKLPLSYYNSLIINILIAEIAFYNLFSCIKQIFKGIFSFKPYIYSLLNDNQRWLLHSLSLLTIHRLLRLFETNVTEDVLTRFSNVLLGLSGLFGCIALKSFIMFTINYNTYFSFYSKRIQKNCEKVELIKKLSELVDPSNSKPVDFVCLKLIENFGSGNVLKEDKLCQILNTENAIKLINYCDFTGDNEITYTELLGFFKKTLNETEHLSNGLKQQGESVQKLDLILFIIFLFSGLFFFIAVNFEDYKEDLKRYTVVAGSIMFTGGYIFSKPISSMLECIVFVFFKRCYEVDDIIKIDDKFYKVIQINLLGTLFYKDSLFTMIPNNTLLDKEIVNIRASKSWKYNVNLFVKVEDFINKKERLSVKFNELFEGHKAVYSTPISFSSLSLYGGGVAQVGIFTNFNLLNQELSVINQRKIDFVCQLNRIFKEVELEILDYRVE